MGWLCLISLSIRLKIQLEIHIINGHPFRNSNTRKLATIRKTNNYLAKEKKLLPLGMFSFFRFISSLIMNVHTIILHLVSAVSLTLLEMSENFLTFTHPPIEPLLTHFEKVTSRRMGGQKKNKFYHQ